MYMHLHTYAFLGIRELLAGESGWFVFIICCCHCLRNNTRGEGQMAPRLRKAENRKGQNNLWAREHLNRQCPGTDGAEHAVLLGVCVSTHSFYLESPQANTWAVFIKKKTQSAQSLPYIPLPLGMLRTCSEHGAEWQQVQSCRQELPWWSSG